MQSVHFVEHTMELDVPTVAIETHGCKLNQADSWELAKEFAESGFRLVSEDEPADVYLLNSCTVTHIADRKARNALRSARRSNPSATVVATGCYAQRSPDQLQSLDGVDIVAGNSEKSEIVRRVAEFGGFFQGSKFVRNNRSGSGIPNRRSRVMVKIQEGCNQVCAYCIVPKVRGRERSVPPDLLVRRIRESASSGFKEVVLTGTQLGSYGFDLPDMNLTELLRRILSETDIPRLRVSSLQPQEIDQKLLDLWSNDRLCPHFHLPLQSGSDSVLKSMRRRYTGKRYIEAVELIRASVHSASVTSDVIVGFPGEGDQDFDQTHALCEYVRFAGIHVFPYSVRPGTSAAHLKVRVSDGAKADRMVRLLSLARRQADDFRRMSVGTTRPVLWERKVSEGMHDYWTGLTDNYLRAVVGSGRDLGNTITEARMTAVGKDHVVCEVPIET